MSSHVRVCRECGEEYRPEATRCSDCGGELEDRRLDESGDFLEPEAAAPIEAASPPEDLSNHRVVFVTPRAAELVPLAEALRADEVPYRLAEQPARVEGASSRFALLVPEPAVPAALRALAPHVAPDHDAEQIEGVETSFEPERGYVRCPACGVEQPPGASDECRECGLGLGALEAEGAACARCGAPMPEAGGPCAACGGTRLG
jgi:ribosomal protein L40E